jgi:hypothetical protein
VLNTIRRATELLRATAGRRGSVVTLSDAEDVLVVGDLHGHVPTFRQVLTVADLNNHPRRHLVLQEIVHGPFDYPNDGGDRSHQLVDLVAALKCQYPERVHILLGNHELSELTGRSIAKNGVQLNDHFRHGVETAYGAAAEPILRSYHIFFYAFLLAVRTPNRVLLCHTIPDGRDLDGLDLGALESSVWPPEALVRGGSVYALTWGRDTDPDTVDRFAALMNADFFITGHQPCGEGYLKANHRQLIIDGTDPTPTYCLFDAQAPMSLASLMSGIRLVPMPAM